PALRVPEPLTPVSPIAWRTAWAPTSRATTSATRTTGAPRTIRYAIADPHTSIPHGLRTVKVPVVSSTYQLAPPAKPKPKTQPDVPVVVDTVGVEPSAIGADMSATPPAPAPAPTDASSNASASDGTAAAAAPDQTTSTPAAPDQTTSTPAASESTSDTSTP